MSVKSTIALSITLGMLMTGIGSAAQIAPQQNARPRSGAKGLRGDPADVQRDLAAIRQMLQEQQQQIQELRNELQQKDSVIQQTQQQLANLQRATVEAQNRAESAADASNESTSTISNLKSDVADIKLNTTNAAAGTQEDQKRMTALENVVNRFRFSGDARIRGESFFQSYAGCPTGSCEDRHRVRLRLRLGLDGKLNEDFTGGIYLATGLWTNGSPSFTDPISTNETATGFFEKKTIGLDRGWITYNPVAHKWLSLTGGKFAYTWQRTNLMFDPDVNPEGFSEKFSFDLEHRGMLKNVTLQGMQLIFNEASKGRDGKALGGQFLVKAKPLSFWTVTPSFTLLEWSNEDAIANAAFPVAVCSGAAVVGCIPQAVTTPVGTPVNAPVTLAPVTLANGVTNATLIHGTGSKQTRGYLSRFTNADLIVDSVFTTPWWNKRLPIHVVGEYEKNLRAATNRNAMYVGMAEIGRATEMHDWILGYSFNRTDQDAIISSFAESDERAPTNVIQHRLYGGWMVAKNTQAMFTWWLGRAQDLTLPNTALLQNNVPINSNFPTKGLGAFDPLTMKDPYLNRLQLDLIYKF